MDEEIDQITGDSSSDTPEPVASTPDPEPPSTDPVADEAEGNSTETDAPAEAAAGEERDAGQEPEPVVAEATPPDPAAPAAIPGAKPFQFKASGGMHSFPGATELPDGSVVITKDGQVELRRALASEREFKQNFNRTQAQFRRDLEAAKTARTAKDVEAEAVYKLFGDLKKMTAEERYDFFQDFDQRAPQLELEVQREQLKLERDILSRATAWFARETGVLPSGSSGS